MLEDRTLVTLVLEAAQTGCKIQSELNWFTRGGQYTLFRFDESREHTERLNNCRPFH